MTEQELFDLIDRAEEREAGDDHLSEQERREVVEAWLSVYGEDPECMERFPADGSINRQFIYILYDF